MNTTGDFLTLHFNMILISILYITYKMTKSFFYIGCHIDTLVLCQSQMRSLSNTMGCVGLKNICGIIMATYISENPIIIRQFFCLKYWPWMELGIWTSRSDPSLTSPLQSALFQENLKLENIILILSNMQFCLNLESRNSLKVVYRKLYEIVQKRSSPNWTVLARV